MSRFLDGGIDTVLVDYLQHLSMDGHYDITLAVCVGMGELEVFLQRIPANVKVVHLVENEMLTKWLKQKILRRLPFYVKAYDEIVLGPVRRHLIKQRIKYLAAQNDVIIDFDCCAYSYLQTVTKRKIAWFHFSFDEVMKQNPRRTRRIGHALEHYDKVVTICQAMCDEGARLFPRLADKLCVIYNAKNQQDMLMRASEPVVDNRINGTYLLAVERLEESQKDISTLLRAYKLLREQYKVTFPLYILGKGHSEEELRQLAVSLGLDNDVVFLGFSSNPYPWMLHARMLIHSAKMEGLPTVLIEGLMLSKLMVSTDCPTGPKEILDEGRAGLLVPVGDGQAMADAVYRLLTDESLQKSVLSCVEQHLLAFTYEETQRKFNQIIKD